MHMADALVSPYVAGVVGAASLGVGAYSVYRIKRKGDDSRIPLMGVMGAFVFAGQMINFAIPGTGSSGHLCGGLMLAALLGPCEAFITMMAVLLVQCLLFADGGLMAYGCNVWNMAFYACFFGYLCVFRPIVGKKTTKGRIVCGSLIGCVLSLQLGAFSVVLETVMSGVTWLSPLVFLSLMQPIHLAIGIVEGIITACVLIFVYSVKPGLIAEGQSEGISLRRLAVIFAAAALFVGGGLSVLASSRPDGLEWSIYNTAGENTELDEEQGISHQVIDRTAIFDGYSVDSFESENAGTRFSGIVGSVAVGVLLVGFCCVFRLFRRGARHDDSGKDYN